MSYFKTCLILTVFAAAISVSGCAHLKTSLVNMQMGPGENSYSKSSATIQGRTIKFGEEETENFGPSFEFERLTRPNAGSAVNISI